MERIALLVNVGTYYIPNSFIIQQAHVTILFNAYITKHRGKKMEKKCNKSQKPLILAFEANSAASLNFTFFLDFSPLYSMCSIQ